MMIVGFSGYARSGKDTAAEALSSLGFVRISFSDKLRDFIYEFNPTVWSDDSALNTDLRDVIDRHGWNGYKETIWSKDIRRQLQVLGTECGRKIIDDNIWVNATFNGLPDGRYALADVRFPNEAKAIKEIGGKVYRITRPGITAANAHVSETALDDYPFDGIIANDIPLTEFKYRVRMVVNENRY